MPILGSERISAVYKLVFILFFWSVDSLTRGKHICTDDDASGSEFGGATTYGAWVDEASLRIDRYSHSTCSIHHWCGGFGAVFWWVPLWSITESRFGYHVLKLYCACPRGNNLVVVINRDIVQIVCSSIGMIFLIMLDYRFCNGIHRFLSEYDSGE